MYIYIYIYMYTYMYTDTFPPARTCGRGHGHKAQGLPRGYQSTAEKVITFRLGFLKRLF